MVILDLGFNSIIMIKVDENFDKTEARNKVIAEHPEYFKAPKSQVEVTPDMLRKIIEGYGAYSQADLAAEHGLTYAQMNLVIRELKNEGLLTIPRANFKGTIKDAIEQLKKENDGK